MGLEPITFALEERRSAIEPRALMYKSKSVSRTWETLTYLGSWFFFYSLL